ncbi:glutaminyl-peptide cyclotransferase [Rhodococcus sp. Leaf7]|uniref:glutaminyl-peptide cyclotransferase n=1 Tax=unclassified Rhodococcus (in: high G+C Gram-positive bacteria) TaxID=192944 RepID=UPI0006FDA462|nr:MULTISPECIES: glutaminyl-peptide cyclotransferase [unclassified Rhodococcus (in: high G+C Gram-positive bacteria)]KQU06834.1 glutaminyl-peptide cyclotransferase [Rhodococcus sp. Leaf7]KQU42353.1 glutaminyl-peptide cyclotransferase [Rhodococcus sp. Leaf247]
MRPGRAVHGPLLIALITGAALVVGCAGDPDAVSTPADATLDVRIVSTRPHDPSAFTQGLEVDGNRLLEGTGRSGRSRVTASDLATGAPLASVDLPAPLFGEGLTVAGDTLWQLTWQDGVAVARDPDTLQEVRRVSYEGEGWGLCFDGSSLVMSDGTDTLTFRDPVTFEPTGSVRVRDDGQAVEEINELECTPDGVYANIWKTDEIVRIDPASGTVTAVIDASPLRAALEDSGADTSGIDVLNGIAAVPDTDRFLVTGKLWPTLFEVEFVPRDADAP